MIEYGKILRACYLNTKVFFKISCQTNQNLQPIGFIHLVRKISPFFVLSILI